MGRGNGAIYLIEQIYEQGQDIENWGLEKRLILLTAPTGCGKTFFAQRYLPDICLKHDTKMAIVVNRKILKSQVEKQNFELMLEKCLTESPTRIFTYQQIEKEYDAENTVKYLKKCEFVVLDEAHFFLADAPFNPAAEKSFMRLLKLIGETCLIFMTATPEGLKPLLNHSLSIINRSRMKRWEADREKLNRRKEICIYGSEKYWESSVSEIARLEEAFKYSEEFRSGAFEAEAPPEPYVYEEVGANTPDYGYVNLNFYNSDEELLHMMIQSGRREKWLIFVNSKKEGRKLEKKLQNAFCEENGKGRTACFISAEYEKYEKMRNVVSEIVKKESYSCSVLITTSVLDNGVTISDPRVKNIVISAFTETEFKQMLGRRRVQSGETVSLYVKRGKLSYFQKFQNKFFQTFMDMLPILARDTNTIHGMILEHAVSWDTVEGFTYKRDGKRKFCFLSYYALSETYKQVRNIVQQIKLDPDAYMRLVCEWMGKDFESDVNLNYELYNEEADSKIADILAHFPNVMTKEQYNEFVKCINEQFRVKISKNPSRVNEFLQMHMGKTQYKIEVLSVAKKSFYYLQQGEDFPYHMCQEVQTLDNLKDILMKNQFDAPELFKRLFGKNIPDIFEQEQQTAFLSFCVKKTKGFEKIAFRRSNGIISIYSDKCGTC